jgi:predicted nucleic acid-binding protein
VKLLADSSALLALVLRRDRNHLAAKRFVERHPAARFVLTELIVAEVVTRVRAWAGATTAVAVGRDLLRSRRYEVLIVDAELLTGALEWMERFGDKRLSLTDCASFEVMERLDVRSAFTFDRGFRDCGWTMVPGDD